MGAWGHGSFENDDALDLVAEIIAGQTWQAVSEALNSVVQAGDAYLEAPEASMALAAAEVVAAAIGRPALQLPEEVAAWVKNSGPPEEDRIRDARRAADRVLNDSELKDLWDETSDSSLWKEGVEELLQRLGPTVDE